MQLFREACVVSLAYRSADRQCKLTGKLGRADVDSVKETHKVQQAVLSAAELDAALLVTHVIHGINLRSILRSSCLSIALYSSSLSLASSDAASLELSGLVPVALRSWRSVIDPTDESAICACCKVCFS